jgi:hypothetical protein
MTPELGMKVRLSYPNKLRPYRKCVVGSIGTITGFLVDYTSPGFEYPWHRQWPIRVTWDNNGLSGYYCAKELQFRGHQR